MALLMSVMALAQRPEGGGGERFKRLESYRIGYITEKLSLTPDEAEKFWPIYKQFREQQKTLNKSYKPANTLDNMSDAEAETFVTRSMEREEKMLDLKKEYLKKLKGVIPARKIAKLRKIEMEFKKEVLKRMKERKREKMDEKD